MSFLQTAEDMNTKHNNPKHAGGTARHGAEIFGWCATRMFTARGTWRSSQGADPSPQTVR